MEFKWFGRVVLFCFICLILFESVVWAEYVSSDSMYVWSENTAQTASVEGEEKDFLDLSCESAILIEQSTGEVLYEKNCHDRLRPASVTKVMTILLIMEALEKGQISYDTQVTCSENAASMGGSQIW